MKLLTIFVVSGLAFILQAKAQPQARFNPFQPGEQLTFVIRYGIIHGGEASFTLKHANYKGNPAYYAKVEGVTRGMADKLYKVKDIYESYFDPKTVLPFMAIRNISEGNYKWYNEEVFNRADTTVISKRSGVKKVPPGSLDMVSVFFYLRRLDFSTMQAGQLIHFNTYFADEVYPFSIRYKGKEVISTPHGRMRCLRFDPVVEVGRVFAEDDDMTVYLTDDNNRLPVLIRFEMWVGSVRCELKEYTGLKYPLDAIVK